MEMETFHETLCDENNADVNKNVNVHIQRIIAQCL